MTCFVEDGFENYVNALREELAARVGELEERLRGEGAASRRADLLSEIASLRAAFEEKVRGAKRCLY